MKTVGIIGGFGPETTAEFYLQIVFDCLAKNKMQKPSILIWNVPLPYSIEEDLLRKNEGGERYLPFLIEAAQKLEMNNVDFIVLPCNTLHIFIDEIRRSVSVPVFSIVEETAAFLAARGIQRVGILATQTTINQKLYEQKLLRKGIEQVAPNGFEQANISKAISNLVINRHDNKDRETLLNIIDSFSELGVKDVILACTDLQLLLPLHPSFNIFDTMKILADATVKEVLSEQTISSKK